MLDWNATIDSIRETLPQSQFQNWFKPVRLLRCTEETVVLGVPNQFHGDWLRNNYAERLTRTIKEQVGLNMRIEFEVSLEEENIEASHSQPELLDSPAPVEVPLPQRPTLRLVETPLQNVASNPLPEQKQPAPAHTPLNVPPFPNTFFEQSHCHVGYQFSMMFATDPGSQINPLVILGGVGMGKTHLLAEIAKKMHQTQPHMRIRFTNAESFTAEMVQALKSNQMMEFKAKYREQTDCLLFDDIQGLSRRLRTQEELLHIFNEILSRGGKVSFASLIAPQKLEDFIEPLKSRMHSGVLATITHPTHEDRVELLSKKCAEDGIRIENEVIRSLAAQNHSDVRSLMGSIIRLHLQAKLQNTVVSHELLSSEGVIHPEPEKRGVHLNEIITLVETNFGVSREEMLSKSRKSVTVWARQVAMFLARHFTLLPLEQIGKTFGRDHATVIHAFQKVQDTMAQNPHRRYQVEFLKKKLSARTGN